ASFAGGSSLPQGEALKQWLHFIQDNCRFDQLTMPILHRASSVPPACLRRASTVRWTTGGQSVDHRWRHKKGISEDFSTGDASLHLFHAEFAYLFHAEPCICFTQNSQNSRKKFP
ncbi:MAG: hypothetical protein MJZ95_04145, partial [Paludibacteraceae bacterium]|nr:hypothetical protein [Paludibacteraceae bacterium]